MIRRCLSSDDLWRLELFVLIHAAGEPVSEEMVQESAERKELHGITATKIRGLFSALVPSRAYPVAEGRGSKSPSYAPR